MVVGLGPVGLVHSHSRLHGWSQHAASSVPREQDLAHLLKQGAGQEVAARLADAQRRSTAQQPVNHYAVLGVKPAATPGEIKAAYKRLALVRGDARAPGVCCGTLWGVLWHTVEQQASSISQPLHAGSTAAAHHPAHPLSASRPARCSIPTKRRAQQGWAPRPPTPSSSC